MAGRLRGLRASTPRAAFRANLPTWELPRCLTIASLERSSQPLVARSKSCASLVAGLDWTLLVQERLPAEGDAIVRVEILDGELLYAIKILLAPQSFNLCPADYCELPGVADGVSGRGLPIERYDPPDAIVDDAKGILSAAGIMSAASSTSSTRAMARRTSTT